MFQSVLFLVVAIAATVSAQLLLKKGMLVVGQLNFSLPGMINLVFQIFQNIYLIFGLIFFGISFFAWLFVLSRIQLNIAYPIINSLNFCFVTLGSWILFKEQLSFFQILGIGFIIVGIVFLVKP